MADRLMADPADREQVALPLPLAVGVPDVQRQGGGTPQMVDVVHQLRPAVAPAGFADLALVPVHPAHLLGHLQPLPADVERMHITGLDQTAQPVKELRSQTDANF